MAHVIFAPLQKEKMQLNHFRLFLRIVSIKVPVTGIKQLFFKTHYFFLSKEKILSISGNSKVSFSFQWEG